MDGLSSAAGVIAVASIALQLAHNIKGLRTFWTNVRDAPQDIQFIVADLQLLSGILADIAFEAQHAEADESLTTVLISCLSRTQTLTASVKAIENDFESTRTFVKKWTAVKAVFKSEKVNKFQDVLEQLKSTLILAQQIQQR